MEKPHPGTKSSIEVSESKSVEKGTGKLSEEGSRNPKNKSPQAKHRKHKHKPQHNANKAGKNHNPEDGGSTGTSGQVSVEADHPISSARKLGAKKRPPPNNSPNFEDKQDPEKEAHNNDPGESKVSDLSGSTSEKIEEPQNTDVKNEESSESKANTETRPDVSQETQGKKGKSSRKKKPNMSKDESEQVNLKEKLKGKKKKPVKEEQSPPEENPQSKETTSEEDSVITKPVSSAPEPENQFSQETSGSQTDDEGGQDVSEKMSGRKKQPSTKKKLKSKNRSGKPSNKHTEEFTISPWSASSEEKHESEENPEVTKADSAVKSEHVSSEVGTPASRMKGKKYKVVKEEQTQPTKNSKTKGKSSRPKWGMSNHGRKTGMLFLHGWLTPNLV